MLAEAALAPGLDAETSATISQLTPSVNESEQRGLIQNRYDQILRSTQKIIKYLILICIRFLYSDINPNSSTNIDLSLYIVPV